MRLFFVLVSLVVGLLISGKAVLASANVSRSFSASDKTIVAGSLVSTVADATNAVELANTSNSQRLVGVAVPSDQSLLAIDTTTGNVQVAISGTADVIVSTLNGDIRSGDQIVVSPISGVGMKAVSNARAIGIAQGELTSTSTGTAAQIIRDTNGKDTTVHVGHIPIAIIIGYSADTRSDQGILGSIQSFASAIAGHNVSVLQTVLSFVVALIAMAALIALIYGAIQGSLVSIGRNPLAGASIYKSLSRVVIMALLIVIVAVAIIYLTLR